jgi:hypothetical protein
MVLETAEKIVSRMDDWDLDDVALHQGGVVGSTGVDFAVGGNVTPRHGYEFVWVRGIHDGQNLLVMRGQIEETRRKLCVGRINQIMRYHGHRVTRQQAKAVASCKGPFIRESAVVKTALESYDNPAWDDYPGLGGGVNHWRAHVSINLRGLSAPRIQAVYELVLAIRGTAPKVRVNPPTRPHGFNGLRFS